jgi:Big-like domain-containing protein
MGFTTTRARRTAPWLMLIACIACRHGDAEAALRVINRPTDVSLRVGDTITVHAVVTVVPNEAPVTVVWSSGNDAVARVDSVGHVTARAPGYTGVTARIGTAFATTRVTVSPKRT